MKKYKFLLLLAIISLGFIVNFPVLSASRSSADMVTYINDLRVNNGLSALDGDEALENAAQNQADYLASTYGANIKDISDYHDRPDGTNEFERVVSAGYPLGPGWYVDEVAYGDDETSTALDAFNFWRGSTTHLKALLNKENVHIGAAISEGDDFAYYVVVFGIDYSKSSAAFSGVISSVPTAAITQEVAPVSVALPNEDGSVFHEVQSGETLWGIAIAYEVTGDQIIALNNLGEDGIIYEGALLQIRMAYTPTPKPSATQTVESPTRTPIPAQTAQTVNTPVPSEETTQNTDGFLGMDRQNMGLALILVSGVGLVLIVVGMLTKDKSSKQDKQK